MMTWPGVLMHNALVRAGSMVSAQAERQPRMDESAFNAFYQKTARLLWHYICRVGGDASLADDILQETYLRFLHAPKRKQDESLMKAYLYKIATHLIIDHWRRVKREQRWIVNTHSHEDAKPALSLTHKDTAGTVILGRDMSRILLELKPLERSLLWLAYAEGSEHREIAVALGLKENSIRVLLYRARQKLARLLKQKGWASEMTP